MSGKVRGAVDEEDDQRQSEAGEGYLYLESVLGGVVARALAAVAERRPDDPVQFVADAIRRQDAQDSRYDRNYKSAASGYEGFDQSSSHTDQTWSAERAAGGGVPALTVATYTSRHETEGSAAAAAADNVLTAAREREAARRKVSSYRGHRSRSLPDPRQTQSDTLLVRQAPRARTDPRRLHAKHIPTAALMYDEYRWKRGLPQAPATKPQLLPPMPSSSSSAYMATSAGPFDVDAAAREKAAAAVAAAGATAGERAGRAGTRTIFLRPMGKTEPRNLNDPTENLDMRKHMKKNKRMVKIGVENKIAKIDYG